MRSLEHQVIQSQAVSQKLIMTIRALGARRRKNKMPGNGPEGGLGKNVVITIKT
jgi:hypothetical protein